MNKINETNNEINILELAATTWRNKWKLIIPMFVSIVFALIYTNFQTDSKLIYKTVSSIKPISTFDEADYINFNSHINLINIKEKKTPIQIEKEIFYVSDQNFVKNSFSTINKQYLLNLFLESLKDVEFVSNVIREFELTNNTNVYQKDINIHLNPESTKLDMNWEIKFKTDNVENSKKFLIFLQETTNEKIRAYLKNQFKKTLTSQQEIIKLQIEDLITNNKNYEENNIEKINIFLKSQKELELKSLNRLDRIFNTTPISDSDNFYSAKILHQTIKIRPMDKKGFTKTNLISIAIFFGLIIGLLYIYVGNQAIKK